MELSCPDGGAAFWPCTHTVSTGGSTQPGHRAAETHPEPSPFFQAKETHCKGPSNGSGPRGAGGGLCLLGGGGGGEGRAEQVSRALGTRPVTSGEMAPNNTSHHWF